MDDDDYHDDESVDQDEEDYEEEVEEEEEERPAKKRAPSKSKPKASSKPTPSSGQAVFNVAALATAIGLDTPSLSDSFIRMVTEDIFSKDEKKNLATKHEVPLRIFDHYVVGNVSAGNSVKQRFTLHGETDIQIAVTAGIVNPHAMECIVSSIGLRNVIKLTGESTTPKATASLSSMRISEREVKLLIQHCLGVIGKRVEIYQKQRANSASYTLRVSGSPGNVDKLEEHISFTDMLPSNSNMFAGSMPVSTEDSVIAIKFGKSAAHEADVLVMGWVCLNSEKRVLEICEVPLDKESKFEELESLLIAKQVKEVLFCQGDLPPASDKVISLMLEEIGIAKTMQPKARFAADSVANMLKTLCQNSDTILNQVTLMDVGKSSLAALVDFLGLDLESLAQKNAKSRITIQIIAPHSQQYVALDKSALRALHVFPTGISDTGRTGSLYGFLNHCMTQMGSRALRKTLSQPLRDLVAIKKRLDRVEALLGESTLRASIRNDYLKKIPDLVALCKKLSKQPPSATLQDVVRMFQFSVRLPLLVDQLVVLDDTCNHAFRDMIDAFKASIQDLQNFEALVESTIDLDSIENHEFTITSAIDPELQTIQETKDDILKQISAVFEKVNNKLGCKQDQLKLERKPNLGYIFRLTRQNEKLIRGKTALYQVLETRKDGVRFTTTELRRLSNKFTEAAEEYDRKQSEFKKQVIETVATYVPVFEETSLILAELDLLCAFAHVAANAPSAYVRPRLVAWDSKQSTAKAKDEDENGDEGADGYGLGLVLEKARHPIVEESLDGKSFIPNDVNLVRTGTDSGGNTQAVPGGALAIVTGPNMGGKSTYIRMAGVLCLMAHCGCFVPAAYAQIPILDRILARVGAGDNQMRGMSTFMTEMVETATILRSATSQSLVIIDELGRGTSTYDGYGLAFAISEFIASKIRASCLFATHFHELTALESRLGKTIVRNLHVSAVADAENKNLVFLYKVEQGACDQSFGIHVAKMARFPEHVIIEAKKKALELEDFSYGKSASASTSAMLGKRVRPESGDQEDDDYAFRVQQFHRKVKELPLVSMDEAACLATVRKLAQDLNLLNT